MNKNGNNEGSVRKRANGTWEARYSDGRDENGHQIQSSVYGKTRKEAVEKLHTILYQKQCGSYIQPSKLLLKDLERIRAKLRRHIEKEAADREAEFEAAMQYHSESDIQEAYGWEFISEQQYEHYLELFRQGRRALDEHSPTVTELALSILNRIFQDIDRDCRQCEFEALSPEEQLAELKRAEESRQAWRQYIASLKEMINPSAAQE